MNKKLPQIFVIFGLITFLLAPFAGLAPLMLLLLGAGFVWAISLIVQVLFFGKTESDSKNA